MVAREVGEERDVELDPRHAVLVEPDGGHFHRHRLRAAARELRELRVQPQRVGRGVDERLERRAQAVAERADHRATPARARQRLRDPLAAGGLAVGAGHADHAQPGARPAVHPARDLAGVAAQLPHAEVGRPPLRVPPEARALPQHARRAAGERLRDVLAAVARLSGIGDKGVARPHCAAVVREPPDAERLDRFPVQASRVRLLPQSSILDPAFRLLP